MEKTQHPEEQPAAELSTDTEPKPMQLRRNVQYAPTENICYYTDLANANYLGKVRVDAVVPELIPVILRDFADFLDEQLKQMKARAEEAARLAAAEKSGQVSSEGARMLAATAEAQRSGLLDRFRRKHKRR
jgi:hypothetical protein